MDLGLNAWKYDAFFSQPPASDLHPVVQKVEDLVEQTKFDNHPFLQKATQDRRALLLWVSQELVMTNAFSQIVLHAASNVKNVHIRAVLCEVAIGEHGKVRKGFAKASHPWLLNQLRESVGLQPRDIVPTQPAVEFLDRLAATVDHPLTAIASIGVGNERLIVPEYQAIKKAFAVCMPAANYGPFLDANLNEDIVHSRLCYEAASALIATGEDPSLFFSAAEASIRSRWDYFDGLLQLVS